MSFLQFTIGGISVLSLLEFKGLNFGLRLFTGDKMTITDLLFFILMKFVGRDRLRSRSNGGSKRELPIPKDGPGVNIAAQIFTFRELAAATKNFRPECFLGEGGFGRVYKGQLESTGQVTSSIFALFYL